MSFYGFLNPLRLVRKPRRRAKRAIHTGNLSRRILHWVNISKQIHIKLSRWFIWKDKVELRLRFIMPFEIRLRVEWIHWLSVVLHSSHLLVLLLNFLNNLLVSFFISNHCAADRLATTIHPHFHELVGEWGVFRESWVRVKIVILQILGDFLVCLRVITPNTLHLLVHLSQCLF